MSQRDDENLVIRNEKGIVEKKGAAFHAPLDFATEILFYVVWSNRYVCNSLYSVKREYLDYYSMTYVLKGQMEVRYSGKWITVRENEGILLDFRHPHEYRAASPVLDKWEMIFKGSASDAYYGLIIGQWGHCFRVHGHIRQNLCRLMEVLEEPMPDDHLISVLIHAIFCEIVGQQKRSISPVIGQAMLFIDKNYGRSLQVSEVADHVAFFSIM